MLLHHPHLEHRGWQRCEPSLITAWYKGSSVRPHSPAKQQWSCSQPSCRLALLWNTFAECCWLPRCQSEPVGTQLGAIQFPSRHQELLQSFLSSIPAPLLGSLVNKAEFRRAKGRELQRQRALYTGSVCAHSSPGSGGTLPPHLCWVRSWMLASSTALKVKAPAERQSPRAAQALLSPSQMLKTQACSYHEILVSFSTESQFAE